MMNRFVVTRFDCLLFMFCIFSQTGFAQTPPPEDCMSCNQWTKQITDKNRRLLNVRQLSDDCIVRAISCLMKSKGNKNPAGFSGATSPEVSEILPHATVEIAALYYISYLYEGSFQHAYGVSLVDKKGIYNSSNAVDIAYSAYHKWFKCIKSIGLAKAKEKHLDPLKGTGIYWYGN